MGGNVGEAIAQAGLGFMQGMAETQFQNHMRQQQNQQKFGMDLGQQLAAQGELGNLAPDMLKPMEKLYGKAGMAQLMQLNQVNQGIRNLRMGAEQTIQAPVREEVAVQNADLQGPPTPQGELPKTSYTRQREATPQEQYERFIEMDPTGISLITGDTNFGNLALNNRILAQNKTEHLFQVRKHAYEDTKPHTTSTFEIERPDGSLGTGVAQVFPDGSHHIIDLSDTANKDAISRHIDRLTKLDEQRADQSLTPQQRKALDMRYQKTSAALEKELSKDKKQGFHFIRDENGEMAGFTTDASVAHNMMNLQNAMVGLDKTEIARDRKLVRGGALLINNVDRLLGMADPATFGPGATVAQFIQNLRANIKSIPGVASFINGSRSDIKSFESKEEQKRALSDFNSAPSEAHQYLLGLIVQMAKMDDPDSVIREGEYDRYKAQIMGGAGVAGSFPAMVANLKAIRQQTMDKVNQSQEALTHAEQIIQQRMQGQMGGEQFGASVHEQLGTQPGQPAQQQPQGMPSYEEAKAEAAKYGVNLTPEMYQQDIQEFQQQSGQKKNSEVGKDPYLQSAADEHGVPVDFLATMMQIESKGDPNAVSPTGATGTFQFTRGTGKEYGLVGEGFDNRTDPEASAKAAAKLAANNGKALEKAGIEPEPYLLYLAHQQGVSGIKAIVKAAEEGRDVSPSIRKNMDLNGGKGLSPQEFLDMWARRWERHEAEFAVAEG